VFAFILIDMSAALFWISLFWILLRKTFVYLINVLQF
jgi:hypothetical protein